MKYLAQAVNLPNVNISRTGGVIDPFDKSLTLGDIITPVLPLVFSLAGIAMLAYIIYGGYTLLMASGDQAAMKKGYGTVRDGIIGFVIIFCSYFAVEIVELVLKVTIF